MKQTTTDQQFMIMFRRFSEFRFRLKGVAWKKYFMKIPLVDQLEVFIPLQLMSRWENEWARLTLFSGEWWFLPSVELKQATGKACVSVLKRRLFALSHEKREKSWNPDNSPKNGIFDSL